MVEGGVAEIAGVAVAITATAREMIRGWGMASDTILIANATVIKTDIEEITRISMASGAGRAKMIWRGSMTGNTVGAGNPAMIEIDI